MTSRHREPKTSKATVGNCDAEEKHPEAICCIADTHCWCLSGPVAHVQPQEHTVVSAHVDQMETCSDFMKPYVFHFCISSTWRQTYLVSMSK